MGIGDIWNLIAVQPMINTLIVLSHYLFNNFGLAIIVLTIVVNAATLPLTLKQVRSSKAMQALQPKLAELQKKYAKDKQRMAQEQMKLYKESGMSPAGCLLPMLVQMPVWIALYQAVMQVLAVVPENLLGLAKYLYPWPVVYSTLPLNNEFLWLDLAAPDRFPILALLVGATMWVQQKMVMTPSADPRQQSQAGMMLWMMPLMFAFLTLSFPSGLALYWVTSNIIRIGIQYSVTGWGGLIKSKPKSQLDQERDKKYKERIAEVEKLPQVADVVAPISTQEEGLSHGESGIQRQDGGGSYPKSIRAIRRKPRRGRGHHHKRR